MSDERPQRPTGPGMPAVSDGPRRIRLHSGGHALAGYLYPPDGWSPGDADRPCVVILQGYSGLRHVYGLELPRVIAAHGWWAITFDHRGFGRSGGPRGRVRPQEQAEDVVNILDYVTTLPGVDADRVALHGSSFGAANALYVAALDERVRALVSCVGVHDCPRWMESLHGPDRWAEIVAAVREAAAREVRDGTQTWWYYPDIVPGDAQAKEIAERYRYADDPLYVDHYDLGSVAALLTYRPLQLAHLLGDRPVLVINAELDAVVPPSEASALLDALTGPKEALTLKGAHHYDAYHFVNPDQAQLAATTALDFLDRAFNA
jgi:fermentation-respiration switch protein FrsA (DUF1100 family)